MTAQTVLALLVFLFPLAYSPGPGNTFFAGIGASQGLRAAVPALAGYHVATFVVTALVGVGLGVTLLEHSAVATSLAAAGSGYVVWLAWGFIRSSRVTTAEADLAPAAPRVGFWSGALVLVLNAKAYYILAVMFAQFLDGGLLTVLVIALIFTLNNLLAFLLWTAGGRVLTALFRSDRARRRIDQLFAATLIGVATWMAVPLVT